MVRPAVPADLTRLAALRFALWPEGSLEEHTRELASYFAGDLREPQAVLVLEGAGGELAGFAEVWTRPYAEGCATDRVGYLEGWYVAPPMRLQGWGRALVESAEDWARAQGCTEFASDTEVDNAASTAAHRALGFTEAGLIRCFRKDL